MFAFFPLETLGKPLEKLLQWMDDHRLFLILPALGILFSLGVFCYVHFRTPPQPEPFTCLLYTSPSPRDPKTSRMPSSA